MNEPYFSFADFASILIGKAAMMSDEILDARKENTWAMLCHLVALLGFFTSNIPLIGLVLPIGAILFVWFLKKDSDPEVNEHGRQSLNWQATIFVVLLLTVVPVMSYQYFKGRNFSQNIQDLNVKIKSTTDEKQKAAYSEELEKVSKALEADVLKGPTSNLPLMATAAFAFIIGLSNIVYVIWNSIRAFRGLPANYPFTVPLLATRKRRGLIRAESKH
jgi:uncharacterized Tic20 family protein